MITESQQDQLEDLIQYTILPGIDEDVLSFEDDESSEEDYPNTQFNGCIDFLVQELQKCKR